jgi:hypothetical protein
VIDALIAFALAQASPQAEVVEAGVALAQCAVPRLQTAASGPEPADALVTAALEACGTERSRIRDLFVRMLGETEADAAMNALVDRMRPRLIRVVDERRGLAQRPQNEATAWGDCIRAKAAILGHDFGTVETLADEAMRQCAPEEAAVRAGLVRERNAEAANQLMPALISASRSVAIQTIQQIRAAH